MYEYTGKIRFSEVDENLDLHIAALVDYFQDGSTFQSEELGIGVEYYKEHKVAWVLNSWQIEIKRMPKMCEEVIIGTFPHNFASVFGHRNFYMKTMDGEFLAVANTVWTMLNLETQRPVKPSEEVVEKYGTEPKLDMEYLDRKIVLVGEPREEAAIVICKNQLDSNHHVNNSQYVKMAVNYLEDETVFNRVRVEYKKAALLGDCLRPMVYERENAVTVSFFDENDKVFASVEFSKTNA